jgi:hypothetical protein
MAFLSRFADVTRSLTVAAGLSWLLVAVPLRGQTSAEGPPVVPPQAEERGPDRGRPGFGPPGPMMMEERKIVKAFDKDGDKRLNREERAAAREYLKKNPAAPRGGGPLVLRTPDGAVFPQRPGGFGPPPGFGPEEDNEPTKPGLKVQPEDVKSEETRDLYAANTLRTLFLDFENDDWEKELADFHGTDVELPATLTVDGVKYAGVGVHFRGMSSYMMVKEGRKRSLNVSLDFTDKHQRLGGYKTLNLLNSHEDDTFLSTVLYSQIARQFIPAPKANFVRVVINGESWGIYVNAQQFDKAFVEENFHSNKGARWKVRGSPNGQSGLDYVGEDLAEYKRRYQLKDGNANDWQALIKLCKTLSETPLEQLEAALAPMLDIDGALWFLALDNALINGDGYWIRASDYTLYRDKSGKFHVIPSDMNEAFRAAGGPGFGPGGLMLRHAPPNSATVEAALPPEPPRERRARPQAVDLDPLVGMDDAKKPLRSRMLAVPALRERYLDHVRTIAEQSLDWNKLGPIVAEYRALIEKEIDADTRKLSTFAAFQATTSDTPPVSEERNGRPMAMNLRAFAEKRSDYLLSKIQTAAK